MAVWAFYRLANNCQLVTAALTVFLMDLDTQLQICISIVRMLTRIPEVTLA